MTRKSKACFRWLTKCRIYLLDQQDLPQRTLEGKFSLVQDSSRGGAHNSNFEWCLTVEPPLHLFTTWWHCHHSQEHWQHHLSHHPPPTAPHCQPSPFHFGLHLCQFFKLIGAVDIFFFFSSSIFIIFFFHFGLRWLVSVAGGPSRWCKWRRCRWCLHHSRARD